MVYKVVRKVDREIYAMKSIDLAGMSRKVCASQPCSDSVYGRGVGCTALFVVHALRTGEFCSSLFCSDAWFRVPGACMPAHACMPVCVHTRPHSQEQESCIKETRVLSALDCDYIIRYYDSFLEQVCTRVRAHIGTTFEQATKWKKPKHQKKRERIPTIYVVMLSHKHVLDVDNSHYVTATLNAGMWDWSNAIDG